MLAKMLFVLLLAVSFGTAGCVAFKRDRCFLAETRYLSMRAIFTEFGSYQRVGQAMRDDGWSHCEINTFRLRLRNDLGLQGEEFNFLFDELEPPRPGLGFNPGRVEGLRQ